MKAFPLLFVLVSGCFTLQGKTIVFPKESNSNYVILKTTMSKPLTELTICLRSYTDLTRNHALISIAMPGSAKENTFILFPTSPNTFSVYVNQEEVSFRVDPDVLNWRHTCVAWDYETGLLQLIINGKSYPRRGTNKGYPIGPELSVILGQDQDHYGGGFEAFQALVGEMRDVHMWDYVLPSDAMKSFTQGYWFPPGNIFSWNDGGYELKGGVILIED